MVSHDMSGQVIPKICRDRSASISPFLLQQLSQLKLRCSGADLAETLEEGCICEGYVAH